jgi:hypothetical protein
MRAFGHACGQDRVFKVLLGLAVAWALAFDVAPVTLHALRLKCPLLLIAQLKFHSCMLHSSTFILLIVDC